MNNWVTTFLLWLGFSEPRGYTQKLQVELAIRQRKEACLRLDRAIRDVALAPKKK